MKKNLYLIFFVFFYSTTNAQILQIKDLSSSLGDWEGKLTYLDYTSGKPYTMAANIKINLTEDNNGYIMSFEYPKEPHANAKDTTYILNNLFGNEKIVAFKNDKSGDFSLVTEKNGIDGNDHQKAILRHSYLLSANTYSIVKEVKFDGTDKWIKRHEYVFTKIK